MSNQEWIDRYIYAVVKQLPNSMREDVSKELQSVIEDMLEARCGELSPGEKDVRVVLSELGTPLELAGNYSSDKNRYLIGPSYFGKYKQILQIVLYCVAFGMLVSEIVSILTGDGSGVWYLGLVNWLGTLLAGLLYGFAVVTILFAVFQKKEVALEGLDWLDALPSVPEKKDTIGKWNSILGISISVIFTVVFLVSPQIIGIYTEESGWIPLLDTDRVRSLWYLILGLCSMGIIREAVKWYEGRYSRRLAVVTVVTNGFSLVLTYLFVSAKNLFNPAFVEPFSGLFEGGGEVIARFLQQVPSPFLIIIAFALLLDTGVTLFKGFRSE